MGTVKKIPYPVDKCTDSGAECGYFPAFAEGEENDIGQSDPLIPEDNGESRKFRELNPYRESVLTYLREGIHQAEIIRRLQKQGYVGSRSNAAYYVKNIREKYCTMLPEYSGKKKARKNAGIQVGESYITEKELMEHIWFGKRFTKEEQHILGEAYPNILLTECCVRDFRQIFSRKNMPLLYCFIERYSCSELKGIAGFAEGLKKDLSAIENAVASPLSNGFVEGTNNKLKMVKRTMYGRCSRLLLEAKLMHVPQRSTNKCG